MACYSRRTDWEDAIHDRTHSDFSGEFSDFLCNEFLHLLKFFEIVIIILPHSLAYSVECCKVSFW